MSHEYVQTTIVIGVHLELSGGVALTPFVEQLSLYEAKAEEIVSLVQSKLLLWVIRA